MGSILLFGLIACAVAVFLSFLLGGRVGYLTVPVFASGAILGWFVPQALIAVDNELLPQRGVVAILTLAIASLICTVLGWRYGPSSYRPAYTATGRERISPLDRTLSSVSQVRLYWLVGAVVAFATIIQLAILAQPTEALIARQPSGFITILRMFGAVNTIALFLAVVLLLHKRNLVTLALTLLALSCFAIPILVKFQRAEIIKCALAFLFAIWAMRGHSIPRIFLPVFAVLAIMVLFGAQSMRSASGFSVSSEGGIETELLSIDSVLETDWSDLIAEGLSQQSHEIKNGVYAIDYAMEHEIPTFGARFWNQFVHRWVPGQFIGQRIEQSLRLDVAGLRTMLASSDYEWQDGTTSTGFTDVFLDFSYLSVLIYFLIAFHARRAYERGLNGELSNAAIYPSLLVLCILSFTHSGYIYFLSLPVLIAAQIGIQATLGQRKPVAIRSHAKRKLGMQRVQAQLLRNQSYHEYVRPTSSLD